jgi:glycosyltransferase involved in cell wall biosynthesis
MKVLQVIAEMGSGGAEAVVEELARGLPEHNYDVAIASAGGRRLSTLRAIGATTYQVPLARRSVVGVLRAQAALATAGRTWCPSVIHAHNVSATVTAHIGLRRLRHSVPLIATCHGVADADYKWAARALSNCADIVVVVSPEVGTRLESAGLRRVRLQVVSNAVTPPKVHNRDEVRASLGISPDRQVALCVARLEVQKRHDVLLNAWTQIQGDALLLLAGTGSQRAALDAKIAELGLAARVQILGERGDVDRLLSAADAVVLSSDWEGLPMSLLEALAAGVPIVATDVNGVASAIGSDAALLVPRREPMRLAAALSAVLGDPSLRLRMSVAARGRSAKLYGASGMVSAYSAIYDDVTRQAHKSG